MPDGPWASGSEAETTNQRMELTAVLEALRAVDGPVEVVSDSTYVVNCFRDRWWAGWLKRGWRNSNKQPVANRDIWEPLIEHYRSRSQEISFTWVKAHSGNEWNEAADRLATEAARAQTGCSGVGLSVAPSGTVRTEPLSLLDMDTDGAPADGVVADGAAAEGVVADGVVADGAAAEGVVADGAAAEGVVPDGAAASGAEGHEGAGGARTGAAWRPRGRSLAVLGLQPESIADPDRTRQRLTEILAAKKELDDDLIVLTGLRRGAETLGAQAALKAGVPYAAVLPYPDPARKWPTRHREQFVQMLEGAAEVVCLQSRTPDTARKAADALKRRNAWLKEVADEALIVWDGNDLRVGAVVSAFERELPDDVWVVDA